MGRSNANDVDLNRNFPNLNEFIQEYHHYQTDRNNHLDIETFLALTSGKDCHDQPVTNSFEQSFFQDIFSFSINQKH